MELMLDSEGAFFKEQDTVYFVRGGPGMLRSNTQGVRLDRLQKDVDSGKICNFDNYSFGGTT